MLAVIPAAGTGSRMGFLTRRSHKGLFTVGGLPILERAIAALRAAGITEVLVVTGHNAELVEERLGASARFVRNPQYRTHGILSSFRAASALVAGSPFVYTTADHVFAPDLPRRLLSRRGDAVSLVQTKARYDEEDSKVRVRDGRAVAFGKDIPVDRADGEYCGMTAFTARGSAVFFDELAARFSGIGRKGYVMDLLNAMLGRPDLRMPLVYCDESERIEVDTVRDLVLARRRLG